MAGKGRNQHLAFLLASCLSVMLTINARKFLPERFLRDNNYIDMRIDTRITFWNDSFDLPVNIYKFFLLGSGEEHLLVSLFGWLVGFLPYYLIYRMHKTFNLLCSILFYTGILLLPFYYFGYTKEIISSFICLSLVIAAQYLNNKSANIFLTLVFLITGSIFRTYWILLAAVFLALTLTGKYHLKLPDIVRIVAIPISSIVLVIICQLANITEVNRARLIPQQSFSDVATNSLLPGVDLGGGFLILVQNIFSVFTGLVFPIVIYKNISLYSIFAIFVCTLLSGTTLMTNSKQRSKQFSNHYHYFPVSLLIIQLIFEPDLGSYVRHVAPFIPLLVMQLSDKKSRGSSPGKQDGNLNK
jgi:hypothetical protein